MYTASELERYERWAAMGASKLRHRVNALLPRITDKRPLRVLDVGGYLGTFSDELLKRVKADITLFEPVPEYADYCKHRLKGRTVEVVQTAVSFDEGKSVLHMSPKNSQHNSLVLGIGERMGEGTQKITVPTMSLTYWWEMAGKPQIDLIKIDVEGGDHYVIEGMYGMLMQLDALPAIMTEVTGWREHPQRDRLRLAYRSLLKLGYKGADRSWGRRPADWLLTTKETVNLRWLV